MDVNAVQAANRLLVRVVLRSVSAKHLLHVFVTEWQLYDNDLLFVLARGGDDLLQQFAHELQSNSRATDIVGRWGGDEFIIVLDCGLSEASNQTSRLSKWVCGDYKVQGKSGLRRLKVEASIGLAEHKPDETMKNLLARADAAMYEQKAASKLNLGHSMQ